MTKEERIKAAKNAFIEKFGDNDPFLSAILAATGRAALYTPNSNHSDIREEWIAQLRQITEKYNTLQTVDTFIADVRYLKEHMNQSFPGRFNNGKPGYENEFRIAHAQKSISVCLKHLWRRSNYLINPPVCPVDGIMLKHVHNYEAWTKVNWINDRTRDGITERGYRTHLALMEAASNKDGFDSVAEWELVVWWESTTKDKTDTKKAKRVKKKHILRTRSVADNQRVSLRVYDGRRVNNVGKTFQIINNPLTLPHTTDHVFVEYNGQRHEAGIGTYTSKNRGDTLRGELVKTLIYQNHWQPGDSFLCEFIVSPEGSHVYRIIQ